MKTEIKSRYNENKILFSHESEDNAVLKTLLEGIKGKSDLRGTDLHGVNLSHVDVLGIATNICKDNLYLLDEIEVKKIIKMWQNDRDCLLLAISKLNKIQ